MAANQSLVRFIECLRGLLSKDSKQLANNLISMYDEKKKKHTHTHTRIQALKESGGG